MSGYETIRQFGLEPDDAALPIVRATLEREAELERAGEDREEDLALLCCALLFSRGLPEDVLRIWKAKRSGFDLGCSIEGEFLLGGDIAATKAWLWANDDPDARGALEWIAELDVDGFSAEAHLDWYRRYFSLD